MRFFNIHSVAKHQKNAGDPLRKKIFRKCLAVPKKIERGDSLVSPGMVCYAEKQVKPFWSSSLGQMVQFDTIILCRTFKNYFGQFVCIEKKVTIIVAFHFMKRRLKTWDQLKKSLFALNVLVFCIFPIKVLKLYPLLHLRQASVMEKCRCFFFARKLSFQAAHSSGVHGLVVRCLLFN